MKVLVVIALAVLGAIGYGVREYSLDRGWLAGKPNSPRPENFKRAIDRHLARTIDPEKVGCAAVGGPPYGAAGFPDLQRMWSPAAYVARGIEVDEFERQHRILATHGYMRALTGADGRPQYELTWKGYAESNRAGCIFVAQVDRDVQVLSFRKSRTEPSVDIYDVTVRPLAAVLSWVKDPGFVAAFGPELHRSILDPAPVTYELARTADGFAVRGEKGKAARAVPAREAQPLLDIDPVRVAAAVDAYGGFGGRNSVCLRLPVHTQGIEVGRAPSPEGGGSVPLTFTVYNVRGQDERRQREVLAGYEMLRRLQGAGLATVELIGPSVQFALNEKAKALLWQHDRNCVLVGTWQVAEIISVQRISDAVSNPRFVARARIVLKQGAEPVVAAFRQFQRYVDAGLGVEGTLRYDQGRVEIIGLSQHAIDFSPDLTEVRLPLIDIPSAAPRR